MTHQSEHEQRVEVIRDQEREKLIALYTEIAVSGSDEYGFLNVRGHEVPDPTVVEPPLGYVPAPDLMTQMRQMLRAEISRLAEDAEQETFEEADDFEIEDDPMEPSPYELYFDPEPDAPAGPQGDSTRTDPNAEPAPPAPPAPPAEPS